MKSICYLTLFFFLILMPLDRGGATERFHAEVVKIIDGDSLIVLSQNKKIEIRLYGIDCPEYDQPFASAAKSYAKKRILLKTVLIEGYYRDSYGRLVATIFYDTRCLNHDLIKNGLAWYYSRYCKKDFCKQWKVSEKSARDEEENMWSEPAIAPWRWKRLKNK